MLEDTSIASMTVPSIRGSGSVIWGRADATASSETATRMTSGGT